MIQENIPYIIIGLAFVGWLLTTIVIVQQKTAVIVEFLGKFYAVRRAGLSFKPPIPFGIVAGVVNLQIQESRPEVGVKSKDNAFLTVPVRVQYKVLDYKIKEAFYELDNPKAQMMSYIINMVRSTASKLTMNELFSSKDSLEIDVKENLNKKFSPFGYEIINVLVDDPQPSQELIEAFNKVLAAEREKDAAINQAEALKIKLVGEARAEKESLELKGQAFKNYRAAIAEGNIEAMGLMLGKLKKEKQTKIRVVTDKNGNKFEEEYETEVYVKNDNPISTNLTEKDILDFFAGVDQREAIRDAAKGEGNTVVVPIDNGGLDYSKIIGLIEGLRKNE